jgi:hypothetical protein
MKTIRIAGVQGFYGDSANGGIDIAKAKAADYLMMDALAELTLSILQKDKLRDETLGYARDIEANAFGLFPLALKNGIKVVTSAGGLNPHSAARKLQALLRKQGIEGVKIAAVTGDDMLARLDELQANGEILRNMDTDLPFGESPYAPTHANVYIGAQAVADALAQGADIVLTGRVADPCLVLGILVHEFGWQLNAPDMPQSALNLLASGIMIGHIIECGGQASGGNAYSEYPQTYPMHNLGYPIAEVSEDGSAVITKLPNVGGKVSRNTIREQLAYEIHDPANYITPDVTVDLTQITVTEIAPNQVRVSGAIGKPRPALLKLCIGQMEGYMSDQLLYFSYPFAYAKAQRFAAEAQAIWAAMPQLRLQKVAFNYLGINGIHGAAAPTLPQSIIDELPEVGLRIVLQHNEERAGKIALQAIVCLGLNGPPGICMQPGWGKDGRVQLSLFPTLISRKWVIEKITFF